MRPFIPDTARSILETGTGSGRYAVALARDLPQSIVTATDIVPESLDVARLLMQDVRVSNVRFEEASLEHLPFRDETFDVVFSDAVIQHVPDDIRAIREMARVLKPSGVLIVAVVNRWSLHNLVRLMWRMVGKRNEYGNERFYSHAALRALVEGCGLEVKVQSGFYPAYGIYRLKRYMRIFDVIGRLLNRVTKILDGLTKGFVSRAFGFEIVLVAEKVAGANADAR